MAKEVTCEILKEYGEIDIDEETSIKVCEIKWNGRQPKGFDIRRYSKDDNRYGKGISIPYDKMNELINIIASNELCDIDSLEEEIKKRKNSRFTKNDFMSMFNKMNTENEKYVRDKYGHLRNSDGLIVICSRRK